MKILSESSVELINSMGTDLSVVNAARVSFHKESQFDIKNIEVEVDLDSRCIIEHPIYDLNEKDKKLLKYLATHNHWSPFAHGFLSFRIKAPIFVARQLVKHQVGLSWNEVLSDDLFLHHVFFHYALRFFRRNLAVSYLWLAADRHFNN